MRNWAITTVFLAAGVGAACGSDAPPAVQSRVALTPFNTCGELEQYIEDTAVSEMNAHLEAMERGEWGWWRGGPEVLAGDANRAASPPSGSSSGPSAYTKTNTQVQGVDEADFIKNDGTRIFVLSGQRLFAVRSWPAASMSLASSQLIEGYPLEMFLDEQHRIVVFSQVYPGQDANAHDGWCGRWCYWGSGFTKVTVFDASNEAQISLVEELYLPGSYAGSRRIGTSVRAVLRDYIPMPNDVHWYPQNYQGDPSQDRVGFAAAIAQTKAHNEAVIRAQTLDDWLPEGRFVRADGTIATAQRNCGSYHRSNAPVRLGVASIATVDLAAAGGPSLTQTNVIGEVGHIYASTASLYIASPHWWWWPQPGQLNHTYLHKFDITAPGQAVYVASGGVDGYILNQFSMDEHQGFLRTATTIDRRVNDPVNPWGRIETKNRVSVLAEQAGALVVVGATPDLAEDERVQSARFIGEKGFLVTFEQIDPLFTLDLSNPTNPRVIGELKVPGFSSYIHPLGQNHLLTIGVHLPEPDAQGRVDWSQRAMKLTIFDVTNFARPVELFTRNVGTSSGWSEAGWEHKAFNYFPERQMLAIPFSDWNPSGGSRWGDFVSDLRLFHIDLTAGITPRGSINMSDVYQVVGRADWSYWYSPWIRRSVMADDFAYAVSDAGIRVANMAAPSTSVATVIFPQQ